jgi:hypothetical protein
MRKSLAECLEGKRKKRKNVNVAGSSRHNTGFVGDLFEFYKPVYSVCYPIIILLHHMVCLRLSSFRQQAGYQGTDTSQLGRPPPGDKSSDNCSFS